MGQEEVPMSILENMSERFDQMLPTAERKQVRLEYLERKYTLLAFIVMAEKKLQTWTVKYRTKEVVEVLLEKYEVIILKIFVVDCLSDIPYC